MKLKKGDSVIIIAGKDKGKTGTVEAVLSQVNRVAVSGVNKYKKHMKPSTKNPQGGIVEIFRALHVSNVALLDGNKKPSRAGYKMVGNDKVRIFRTTGEEVGKK